MGGTWQLNATVEPEDAENKSVTWESSDEAVATVDENGLVTGKSAGSATVTVRTVDGGYTAQCSVTVEGEETVLPTGVTLSHTTLNMKVGEEAQLIATVQPADATDKSITWESNAPETVRNAAHCAESPQPRRFVREKTHERSTPCAARRERR